MRANPTKSPAMTPRLPGLNAEMHLSVAEIVPAMSAAILTRIFHVHLRRGRLDNKAQGDDHEWKYQHEILEWGY